MTEPTKEHVLGVLSTIIDPESGASVVEAGLILDLVVRAGHVRFVMEVPPERGQKAAPLLAACEDAVKAIDGVEKVSAILTAHEDAEVPQSPHAHHDHHRIPPPEAIPGVRTIIAVASGKGGVGKSTVSVNLALALQALGLKVGLLDADIYGPSVPKLLGLAQEPAEADGRMIPVEKYGLKAMSIGFLVDEGAPMIWRGPMVQSALVQMLKQVAWAPLDVLVVDMPPGTGDAQLAIVQTVPLAGAVIVSTPQDLALLDAGRATAMFRTTKTPVLGLVENMSGFACPHCGKTTPIFGQGGAETAARQSGLDFLGAVPLTLSLRQTSDEGAPVVATAPDTPEAAAFHLIAKAVAAKIIPPR